MKRVFLLTGSNLGESILLMRAAVFKIEDKIGRIIQLSHIYSSESWGYRSLRVYYNQCIEVETAYLPHTILEKVLEIEVELGRVRSGRGYSDREIDIDLLFFDDEVFEDAMLTIPHPRIHLRKFALVPMNEIAGDFTHPFFEKTIKELLADCKDESKVTLYREKL